MSISFIHPHFSNQMRFRIPTHSYTHTFIKREESKSPLFSLTLLTDMFIIFWHLKKKSYFHSFSIFFYFWPKCAPWTFCLLLGSSNMRGSRALSWWNMTPAFITNSLYFLSIIGIGSSTCSNQPFGYQKRAQRTGISFCLTLYTISDFIMWVDIFTIKVVLTNRCW